MQIKKQISADEWRYRGTPGGVSSMDGRQGGRNDKG